MTCRLGSLGTPTLIRANPTHLVRESAQFFLPQFSNSTLVRPAPKIRADREPGAHGRKQHQVALAQLTFIDGIARSQRDGRTSGIAEPFDVDDDLIRTHAQPVLRRARVLLDP